MTTTTSKADVQKTEAVKEFKPFKKLSPFVSDPFNTRGGKGGKKGAEFSNAGGAKGGKSISIPKFKGGSGGDR